MSFDDQSPPRDSDAKTAEVFTSTILQPWSNNDGQSSPSKQRDKDDLQQLVKQKNDEIESLRQQLYDKEQLISEIGTTIETLRRDLAQVNNVHKLSACMMAICIVAMQPT